MTKLAAYYIAMTLGAALTPLPWEIRVERLLSGISELIVWHYGAKHRIGQWARGIYYIALSLLLVKLIYGYSDTVEIIAIPLTAVLTLLVSRRTRNKKLGFRIRDGAEFSVCVTCLAVMVYWLCDQGSPLDRSFVVLGIFAVHTFINQRYGHSDEVRQKSAVWGLAGPLAFWGWVLFFLEALGVGI